MKPFQIMFFFTFWYSLLESLFNKGTNLMPATRKPRTTEMTAITMKRTN